MKISKALLVAALVIAASAGVASADDWNNALGGTFGTGINWLDGTAPTALDTVNFALPALSGTAYVVDFDKAETTGVMLLVNDQDVTLQLHDGTNGFTWSAPGGSNATVGSTAAATITYLGNGAGGGSSVLHGTGRYYLSNGADGTMNVLNGAVVSAGMGQKFRTRWGATGQAILNVDGEGSEHYCYMHYLDGGSRAAGEETIINITNGGVSHASGGLTSAVGGVIGCGWSGAGEVDINIDGTDAAGTPSIFGARLGDAVTMSYGYGWGGTGATNVTVTAGGELQHLAGNQGPVFFSYGSGYEPNTPTATLDISGVSAVDGKGSKAQIAGALTFGGLEAGFPGLNPSDDGKGHLVVGVGGEVEVGLAGTFAATAPPKVIAYNSNCSVSMMGGTMTIAGDFATTGGASTTRAALNIAFNASGDVGQITCQGAATTANLSDAVNTGSITYSVPGGTAAQGFVPTAAANLDFVTATTISDAGLTDNMLVVMAALNGGEGYGSWGYGKINDTMNDILRLAVLPGDANQDKTVDGNDLAPLLANWGPMGTGVNWTNGDFDYNDTGDGADLAILLLNWGKNLGDTSGAGAAAVPEPVTLVLLGLGGLAMLRRRR